MFSYIVNEEKIKYISTMNKCKRKKKTNNIRELRYIIRKKKKNSHLPLKNLNML